MAQTQLRAWSLPPYYIDFTLTPPYVDLLPIGSSGSLNYTGQTGNHNMIGLRKDILFFIVDDVIYNDKGEDYYQFGVCLDRAGDTPPYKKQNACFHGQQSNFVAGNTEHLVVPMTGSCGYDIISSEMLNKGEPWLYYNPLNTQKDAGLIFDTIINFAVGEPPGQHIPEVQLAATLRRPDRSRFLFAQRNLPQPGNGLPVIDRFLITDAGITFDGRVIQDVSVVNNTEMEVISLPDKTYLLALLANDAYGVSCFSGTIGLIVLHLDEQGELTGEQCFELSAGQTTDLPKGIEISPEGNYVYFTSLQPPYLFYVDLAAGTGPHALKDQCCGGNIPDAVDFSETQIELAYDGHLYYAGPDRLAYLTDPENPASAWVDPAPLQNVTITTIAKTNGIRILPDQIDGEDYSVQQTGYATGIITVSADAVWTPAGNPFGGNTVFFAKDLIIAKGVTLTVRDMDLKFDAGAHLDLRAGDVAANGAVLILNNTVLSSSSGCRKQTLWEGVRVGGNNTSQYTDPYTGVMQNAKLVMQNNAGILEAVAAVDVEKGGIVKAEDSFFRNNRKGVHFFVYNNYVPGSPSVLLPNLSQFRNCVFETTETLKDGSLPTNFVELLFVNGIGFYGNTFRNTRGFAYDHSFLKYRGSGIAALDASFKVLPLCTTPPIPPYPCAEQDLKRNVFEDLDYGVFAASITSLNPAITIDKADFSGNRAAVRFDNVNYATVARSEFTVPDYTTFTTTSQIPVGLYLSGCTGYKVEENTFDAQVVLAPFPQPGPPGSHFHAGAVILNSGHLSNILYRNTFSNFLVNVLAEGVNRQIKNAPGGLIIKCNDFNNLRLNPGVSNIGWDIASPLLGLTNNTTTGISRFQGACDPGDPKSPAGNRFFFSNCPPNSNANILLGDDPNIGDILYSHQNDFVTTPQANCYLPPPSIDPTVTLNPCSFTYGSNSCPSTLGKGLPKPILLNTGCVWIGGQLICFKEALDALKEMGDSLSALIDGGSTQVLLNTIAQGNPGQTRNTLLTASPYLSDQVLIAAINAGLPPGTLQQILMANSPLTAAVTDALQNIFVPNGVMNNINSLQTGISERTKLEAMIAWAGAQRELAVNEILRHHLSNDTLSLGLQRAKQLLKEEDRRERKHEEAEIAIREDDLTRAEFIIDSLHNGNPDDACKLKEIRINLKQQNKTLAQMSITQEQEVRAIAADTVKRPCHQARAMLREAYGEHDMEIIALPGQNQLKMAQQKEKEKIVMLSEDHDLKIFPNPFEGYTSIEAYVPEKTVNSDLVIYNLLGLEQKKYKLTPGYNIITILSEDLPEAGIYLTLLKADGKILKKRKMILVQ